MTNCPSNAQLERLVEFLEQNPRIAKGLLRTTQAKLEAKKKWANLATCLNSLGILSLDGDGWAKYWDEKKCALKKQFELATQRLTDGWIVENVSILSNLDNRFVTIMGGQDFLMREARLAVNPLTRSTSSANCPVVKETILQEHVREGTKTRNTQMSSIPGTPGSQNDAVQAPAIRSPGRTTFRATRLHRRRRRFAFRGLSFIELFASIEQERAKSKLIKSRALLQLAEKFAEVVSALTSVMDAIAGKYTK